MITRRQFLTYSAAIGAFHCNAAFGQGQGKPSNQAADKPNPGPGKYYLCPYESVLDDDGVTLRFVPKGIQGQEDVYEQISLRPNAGSAEGYGFLYLPDTSARPQDLEFLVNDHRENVPSGKIKKIEDAFGITLTKTSLREIIAETIQLLGYARPSIQRQRHEIYLNGLIIAEPIVQGYWDEPLYEKVWNFLAATFSLPAAHAQTEEVYETWDCGNTGIGNINCLETWDMSDVGNIEMNIQSSRVHLERGGSSWQNGRARCTTALSSDNHYSQFTLAAESGNVGSDFFNTLLLCRVPTPTSNTGYELGIRHRDAARNCELARQEGGFNGLGQGGTVVVGNSYYVSADGNSIEARQEGATIIGPVTDPTPLVGNLYGAIGLNANIGGGRSSDVDTFIMDPLAPAPSASLPAILETMGDAT